tara:strand:- start:95 stop:295 length:201 start_codon:yes stop_codon:yes gene_type:complete
VNVLFDTHVDDWVEVLLELELLLDSSSFLLQERENKSGETKRMRNNPTGFRLLFIKYFLFIVKLKI